MKTFITLMLVTAIVVPVFVGAQVATSTLPDPGTLPDSPFYFLKSWRESIQLFFTFGAELKAEQYLHLAEVRLAEYEKMLEKGKDDIAERTLEKYENQLERALTKAEELKAKGDDVADELKTKVEEAASKHLSVLGMNLDKVSESARAGIGRALEASRKQLEKLDNIFDEEFENLLEGDDEDMSAVPADWKTYRNERYGFQFKHPPRYSVDVSQLPGRLSLQSGNTNDYLTVTIDPPPAGLGTVTIYKKDVSIGTGQITAIGDFFGYVEDTDFLSFFGRFKVGEQDHTVLASGRIHGSNVSDIENLTMSIVSTFRFISSSGSSNLDDFDDLFDDAGLEDELDNLLEGLE